MTQTNRINQIFEDHRRRGRKALMPFLTAGDPDLSTTARLLGAAEGAGASVCELGFPFSDPIADGPVIQASMSHALSGGVRPAGVLEMVARVRRALKIGLVAMVSYSIVHRLGLKSFVRDARQAGIDGFIFPDLPIQCAEPAMDTVLGEGLVCSFLIAPTTPIERARQIAQASSGFVYLLSRAGVTGERTGLPAELGQRVDNLRLATDLPIAVGFGISTREHVQQVAAVADAAIVGSAIMRRVAQFRDQGPDVVENGVAGFVADLAEGLAIGAS